MEVLQPKKYHVYRFDDIYTVTPLLRYSKTTDVKAKQDNSTKKEVLGIIP